MLPYSYLLIIGAVKKSDSVVVTPVKMPEYQAFQRTMQKEPSAFFTDPIHRTRTRVLCLPTGIVK